MYFLHFPTTGTTRRALTWSENRVEVVKVRNSSLCAHFRQLHVSTSCAEDRVVVHRETKRRPGAGTDANDTADALWQMKAMISMLWND